MVVSANAERPVSKSIGLLRAGEKLRNDVEIRDLFVEAFNPSRPLQERQQMIDTLKEEMARQIKAFDGRDKEQLYAYDKTRGAASYLKSDRAEFEAALDAGIYDFKPDQKRLTFERLVNGDVPKEVLALPRDTIVVSIMSSGMLLGSGIVSAMRASGSNPDTVMVGYPRSDRYWENGEKLPKSIFIDAESLTFLSKNTNKIVLIVDDMIEDGNTLRKVKEFLSDLGFKSGYQLIFYSNNPDFAQMQGKLNPAF